MRASDLTLWRQAARLLAGAALCGLCVWAFAQDGDEEEGSQPRVAFEPRAVEISFTAPGGGGGALE